jgi:hypothetical protein
LDEFGFLDIAVLEDDGYHHTGLGAKSNQPYKDPSPSSGMGFLLSRITTPAQVLDFPERLFSLKRFQRDAWADIGKRSLRNRS